MREIFRGDDLPIDQGRRLADRPWLIISFTFTKVEVKRKVRLGMRCTPALSAAAISVSASSRLGASGISQSTCLPALIAARATLACNGVGTATTTALTAGSFTRSA